MGTDGVPNGVAVVGSINADLVAYAEAVPGPGETVVGNRFAVGLGGKGANQAVAAARAGAPTWLIGAVGDDAFGRQLLTDLAGYGVETSAVAVVEDTATGVAHIRVDESTGQNDIVIVPLANLSLTSDRAEAALRSLGGQVSVVLVQLEIPLDTVVRVAAVCRELGLTLILDPAPAQPVPDVVWPGVTLAKPNESEARLLTGIAVVDEPSALAAAQWFVARGAGAALITRGGAGAVALRDGMVSRLRAYEVTAVDTTAAGDAVTGTLGAALASGLDWDTAMRRALAAGALAVTVRGASASLPSADAVTAFLSARASSAP